MEIFAPYLLCVIFLAVMYGLMRLALLLSNAAARRSIYRSGIYTPKTVHTLLLAQFGAKRMLSGKYLSENAAALRRGAIDHILLLNGAIVIVTIRKEDGVISNFPSEARWSTHVYTKRGTEQEIFFENPLAEGARMCQRLAAVLADAGCLPSNPATPTTIEHIVIFPSRKLSFVLKRQQQIMSPPEALRYLKRRGSSTVFTKENIKDIKTAIKRFNKTESQIAAKKAKSRHR